LFLGCAPEKWLEIKKGAADCPIDPVETGLQVVEVFVHPMLKHFPDIGVLEISLEPTNQFFGTVARRAGR
jgi:hypothetical protein